MAIRGLLYVSIGWGQLKWSTAKKCVAEAAEIRVKNISFAGE